MVTSAQEIQQRENSSLPKSIGLGGRPSFGNMARRSSQHTVHSEVDYVPDLADKVNLKVLRN
eukprot:2176572-Amphidinium_carterae.1